MDTHSTKDSGGERGPPRLELPLPLTLAAVDDHSGASRTKSEHTSRKSSIRGSRRTRRKPGREWASVVSGLHDVEQLFWQSFRARTTPDVARCSLLACLAVWLACAYFLASAWAAPGLAQGTRIGVTASCGAAALLCTALTWAAWGAGTNRWLRLRQHLFAAALSTVLHAWALYLFCGAYANPSAVPAALAVLGYASSMALRLRFFAVATVSGSAVVAFAAAYAALPELRAADPPAALSVLLAGTGLCATLYQAYECEARARKEFMVEEGLAARWVAEEEKKEGSGNAKGEEGEAGLAAPPLTARGALAMAFDPGTIQEGGAPRTSVLLGFNAGLLTRRGQIARGASRIWKRLVPGMLASPLDRALDELDDVQRELSDFRPAEAHRLRSVLQLLASRKRELDLPDIDALDRANSGGMDAATRQWLLGEIVPQRHREETGDEESEPGSPQGVGALLGDAGGASTAAAGSVVGSRPGSSAGSRRGSAQHNFRRGSMPTSGAHSRVRSPIASFFIPPSEGGHSVREASGPPGALQTTPPTHVAPFTVSPSPSMHLPPASVDRDGSRPASPLSLSPPHTLRSGPPEPPSGPGPLLSEATNRKPSTSAPSSKPVSSAQMPPAFQPAPPQPAPAAPHALAPVDERRTSLAGGRRRASGGGGLASSLPRRVSLIPPPSTLLLPSDDVELRAALVDNLDDWLLWDVFRVGEVAKRRCLAHVGYAVLRRWGVIERFGLDVPRLVRFLDQVELLYNDTPYHCALHASDVVQSLSAILAAGIHNSLKDIEILAGILAAVVHDLGHNGFTNAYEVAIGSERAIVYNDKSPLENFHISRAFQLLRDPANDFLSVLSVDERKELRRIMIAMVLGTDLASHFELLGSFKTRSKDPNFGSTSEDRLLALQLALKCADVGNGAKARNVHFAWVARVMEEFFTQGDCERERGMNVSAWSDRSTPQVARCQLGFLNFILIPMYTAWVGVFPGAQRVLDAATANRDFWADRSDDGALPPPLAALRPLPSGTVPPLAPVAPPPAPAAATSSPRVPALAEGGGSGKSKNRSFRLMSLSHTHGANTPSAGNSLRQAPALPLNAPPLPKLPPASPVILQPELPLGAGPTPVPITSDLSIAASSDGSIGNGGAGGSEATALVIDIRP